MITIVIPTYNRALELKRCIESILPQSYPGLKVIVVDDASTDATPQLLATMQQEHALLQVIRNEKNAGVNYSRNRGIEQACTPYILFLDSDEQLLPGGLFEIMETLQANPRCRFFLFLQADRWKAFSNNSTLRSITYEDWIREAISGDFIHVVDAAIMKKYRFFEEFRMFEYLNWLRIKKETAPQLLKPVVVAERETARPDSLTVSARLNNTRAIQAQFESRQLYYTLYHDDLQRYYQRSLRYPLLKTVLLGVACNRKAECRSLIRNAGKLPVRLAGRLLTLLPAAWVRKSILRYTAFK